MCIPTRFLTVRRALLPPFQVSLTNSFRIGAFQARNSSLGCSNLVGQLRLGQTAFFPQFRDPMRQPQAPQFIIVSSTELRSLSADSKSIGAVRFFFMSNFLHPVLCYFHFPARCLPAFLHEAMSRTITPPAAFWQNFLLCR